MKTKEEAMKEAHELLLRLEVFDCAPIWCNGCPLDTNKKRGAPHPSTRCYSNQAREQREWLRSSNISAKRDE